MTMVILNMQIEVEAEVLVDKSNINLFFNESDIKKKFDEFINLKKLKGEI